MDLIDFIIVVVVIGLIMYAVNRWVPMPPQIKQFLNIAVVVLLVVWLISMVVGWPSVRIG